MDHTNNKHKKEKKTPSIRPPIEITMATPVVTATLTTASQVDAAQMNTFRSYVTMLADAAAKDEIKLKAAQELSENFELITQCVGFPGFLEHSLKIFIRILQEGEAQFISENNMQQTRKLLLEMIHRLPTSEILRPYVNNILVLMLKLLQVDNEENVLVCLRIIIELHKQYRPAFNQDVRMWNIASRCRIRALLINRFGIGFSLFRFNCFWRSWKASIPIYRNIYRRYLSHGHRFVSKMWKIWMWNNCCSTRTPSRPFISIRNHPNLD